MFPNEFGQKKHPLFFINWIWRRKNNGVKNNYEPPGGSPVDLEVLINIYIFLNNSNVLEKPIKRNNQRYTGAS